MTAGTKAEEFELVGDSGEAVTAADAFFKSMGEAVFDFNHFRAMGADQMVMMTFTVGGDQLVAGDAVAKIEAFDQAEALEKVKRAIDGGEIAPIFVKQSEDVFGSKRGAAFGQKTEDGLARPRDAAGPAAEAGGEIRKAGGGRRMRMAAVFHAGVIPGRRWQSQRRCQ